MAVLYRQINGRWIRVFDGRLIGRLIGRLMADISVEASFDRQCRSVGCSAVEVGRVIKSFVDAVIASVADGNHPSSRTLRKRAFQKLYKLPNIDTPYGQLMTRLEVVGTRGIMKLLVLNTFTLFVHAARISRRFSTS